MTVAQSREMVVPSASCPGAKTGPSQLLATLPLPLVPPLLNLSPTSTVLRLAVSQPKTVSLPKPIAKTAYPKPVAPQPKTASPKPISPRLSTTISELVAPHQNAAPALQEETADRTLSFQNTAPESLLPVVDLQNTAPALQKKTADRTLGLQNTAPESPAPRRRPSEPSTSSARTQHRLCKRRQPNAHSAYRTQHPESPAPLRRPSEPSTGCPRGNSRPHIRLTEHSTRVPAPRRRPSEPITSSPRGDS